MKKLAVLVLTVGLMLAIGLGVNYVVSHYGSINYEWKSSFLHYHVYNIAGDSVLNGYIKADGNISVYILTKEDFKRLKNGEPFNHYKAWEHVKNVKFANLKIPKGDYILVVKNDENGRRWISAKIIDRKV